VLDVTEAAQLGWVHLEGDAASRGLVVARGQVEALLQQRQRRGGVEHRVVHAIPDVGERAAPPVDVRPADEKAGWVPVEAEEAVVPGVLTVE